MWASEEACGSGPSVTDDGARGLLLNAKPGAGRDREKSGPHLLGKRDEQGVFS